jgi:hypothetical protein
MGRGNSREGGWLGLGSDQDGHGAQAARTLTKLRGEDEARDSPARRAQKDAIDLSVFHSHGVQVPTPPRKCQSARFRGRVAPPDPLLVKVGRTSLSLSPARYRPDARLSPCCRPQHPP